MLATATICLPVLALAAGVGLIVAIFQAAAPVQEQTYPSIFARASRPSSKRSAARTACRRWRSLHRAFGNLLRERVWPRDPVATLEAKLESGAREPRELAEAARRCLVPQGVAEARTGPPGARHP